MPFPVGAGGALADPGTSFCRPKAVWLIVRVFDAIWMQVEEYLRRDDRVVLPSVSTEQHGYLSLGTDAILAGRVAVEAAEPLGVPVLPVLPFGMALPGLRSRQHEPAPIHLRRGAQGPARPGVAGFRRIAIINGHGGQHAGGRVHPRVLCCRARSSAGDLPYSVLWAAGDGGFGLGLDREQAHANWGENFPWNGCRALTCYRARACCADGGDHPARREADPKALPGGDGRRVRPARRGHGGAIWDAAWPRSARADRDRLDGMSMPGSAPCQQSG